MLFEGRRLFFALALVASTASCAADPPKPAAAAVPPPQDAAAPKRPAVDDKEAVAAAMNRYKEAIAVKDGEAAAECVATNSFTYFDIMKKAALEAPEAEVRKKPSMDRLIVLTLRHRVPVADLRTMTGRQLFVFAIQRGMVGDVRALQAGEVEITGDTARVGIRTAAGTLPASQGFHAVRERGGWKVDVMRFPPIVEAAFGKILAQVDPDTDKAILKVVELASDKPVTPAIWKALGTRGP